MWRDGEEGGKGGGGRWMTGSENGKAKNRTFALTFFFMALRTWEVCGGSALTLGLNLHETPGLAKGGGGAITSFEVQQTQKSNLYNHTLKENNKNCMLRP